MDGVSREKIPVFILAGGLGTRLSEETHAKPKPMVEIGDLPILVHLMRWYYRAGFSDFVICGGYRVWEIKRFFLNYNFRTHDLDIDLRKGYANPEIIEAKSQAESWRVRVIDTGLHCMTGARVARAFDIIQRYQSFETFAVTYGDGLSDIPLEHELDFHCQHKKLGTVLGVPPMARFGELEVDESRRVNSFLEKPHSRQGFINGGFFFFEKAFREYLDYNEDCILERAPLSQLAENAELMMYPYTGFWHPMDTLRDKIHLEKLWESGEAPWK